MQDSQVTITITAVDGATKTFEGVGDSAVKQANRAANAWIKANDVANVSIQSSGEAANATNRASKAQDNFTASTRRSYFAQTALTTVLSAGINKAFLEMVDVTGQAIQRVDLLSNFPKSMAALGLSATDASESMSKLSSYVGQIGGNLQDATTSVTRFAEVTKNVKAATAEFIGVNNALIAGGAGAQVQANALEQLIQAYSRGKPQLIEWRSLMVAMPAQLNLVAKAMGQPNAQALGEQLTNGKISMQEFLTQLTKLSTGSGPIVAQMYARMNGIEFAFTVFKNTLVQGMTNIIQTIGRQNIIDFFNLLTGVVQVLAQWAVQLISILFGLFNVISKVFGGPQLKLANDNTAGIADNLGAGADNAGDLADNLDDADKAAQNTLAAFDKMNVLEPPKAPKNNSLGGQDGLTPQDASALEGVFNDLQNKMNGVSTAAKILAGILASIASIKFGQALLNQFNGVAKTLEDTGKNIDKLKDKFKNITIGNDISKSAEEGAQGTKNVFEKMASFILGVFAGLGPAIASSFSGLAAALGVSTGGLGLIIAGAVAGIIIAFTTIRDNWDAIVKGMAKTWKLFTDALVLVMKPAIDALSKAWNGLIKTLSPTIEAFAKAWNGLLKAAQPFFDGIAKFYNKYLAPAIDKIGEWIKDNIKLGNTLQVIGTIITVSIVAPLALTVGAIAAVVIAFGIVAAAIAIVIAKIVEFANYFISGKLFDDVSTVFSDIGKFIVDIFTIAVLAIFAVLVGVSQWVSDNVVKPTIDVFVGLWNGLVNGLQIAWNTMLAIFQAIPGLIYSGAIKPTLDFFTALWNGIVNIFKGTASWFVSVFNAAWNGIKNVFGAVGSFFQSVWNNIVSIFGRIGASIGDAVGNAFKSAVNAVLGFLEGRINNVIDLMNGAIGAIDNITPGSLPRLGRVSIPRLAQGGIVDQPTFAQVGEAGAEAIMPLENNTEWIDKLASKINTSPSQSNQNPDIIPVTNKKDQPSGNNFTIIVQGVFATSTAEQQKVADLIAKQLNAKMKAKGLKEAF